MPTRTGSATRPPPWERMSADRRDVTVQIRTEQAEDDQRFRTRAPHLVRGHGGSMGDHELVQIVCSSPNLVPGERSLARPHEPRLDARLVHRDARAGLHDETLATELRR